jgi:O-antigen ligase
MTSEVTALRLSTDSRNMAAHMLPALMFALLTLPWLNPFAPGPTPAVVPFLFSWLCIVLAAFALSVAHTRGQAKPMVRVVAMAWVAAACLSALIGLLQYFEVSEWAGRWINHTELGQAYGNLRQRNQFATLLTIGLAALLWWASYFESSEQGNIEPALHQQHSVLLWAAATLLGAGNAASSSRTGLFQLALIAWLGWLWQHQKPSALGLRKGQMRLSRVNQVLLICLLSYALATLALPVLAGLDPLSSGAWARLRQGDAACSSRLTLWSNVLHLIAQKPWLGWGWGELDYAHFITLYPGTRFCDILDNAHNLPLHIAVELGVPLAVVASCAGTWLVWRTQPWRESDSVRQMAWTVLAVIGLHSLLEYPLWYGPFQMVVLLCLWLLLVPQATDPFQIKRKDWPPALYLSGLATIVSIATISYIAWNYQLASQIYLSPKERMAAYSEDTLEKVGNVALFEDQVRFADLTTTALDAQSARKVHDLALDMLHFSPEAQVVEMLLESAKLLEKTEEVLFFAARFKAAFPQPYESWVKKTQTK